jgi:two-component system sensor histidine kinase AlgZ
VGSWLIIVCAAFGFSYFAGVIGSVLGWGPGQASLGLFMLVSVIAVALVAMAFLRYLFIREQWRAQLIAQAEARVQALQARIRPHFLFNSLNTIASLVPEDPEGAERAIEDLADVFRGGMRAADRLISLSDELRLARQYLAMEQRRLGDRLVVDWDVSELPDNTAVLPLILQPLLENAVGHGIQTLDEGGTVRVYGREAGGQVVITISNPLPGAEANTGGHGMALRNIRERLELAFAGRAGLITQQDDKHFFAVLSLPRVEHTDH